MGLKKSWKDSWVWDDETTTSHTTWTSTTTTGKPIEIKAPEWKLDKIEINSPITIDEPKGWICPKCGRVNAPWVATCSCSQTQTKTIKSTWTTNIPSYCMGCSNHPINGGSGICHCILGSMKVTC